LRQGNVFVEQSGRHDLRYGQVPAVAHIFVLALRPDVRDLLFVQSSGPPLAARRRRPYVAAKHLQQQRFARAIWTDQRPALAAMQGEVDLVEHDVPVENQGAAG
jgi:hypothetical protein